MRLLFRKQPQTSTGIVFPTRVLIGRNYVTVVVNFITFETSTEINIFVNVPCYGFSRRPSGIYRFRLTWNHLRCQLFLPVCHFQFLLFPWYVINYLVSTCLLCELQALLADNIHTHYVNKSLWTGKQYHFLVELNKTTWLHRLKYCSSGQIV